MPRGLHASCLRPIGRQGRIHVPDSRRARCRTSRQDAQTTDRNVDHVQHFWGNRSSAMVAVLLLGIWLSVPIHSVPAFTIATWTP